jgi:trans-aconitate 2-methyltransferase
MSWDPKTYLAFAGERTRPAAELLARIPDAEPGHVADLGCGPGNSTALLAARWPRASIEGVDPSESMLEEARGSAVRARWTKADIASWKPNSLCDVIFSNATFQWLDDHEALLPRLMGYVAHGGIFAFQVPRNFDEPSHALMREVASEGPWSSKLSAVRRVSVFSPQAYYGLLAARAAAVDIWETIYLHALEGDDAVYRWVSGTGLRPFADALAGQEREDFLGEYRARLRVAYPRRADGTTLFPFRRLFVVARK